MSPRICSTSFAVDQPRYAEAIYDHAKTLCPERCLQRHYNPTAVGQRVKDALGISRVLDLKREREALWFLILIRRYVGAHQRLAADCQVAVHDLVGPIGRSLIRHGRPGVTEDRPELGAETLLIEFERRLAISLEAQIRIHLHG